MESDKWRRNFDSINKLAMNSYANKSKSSFNVTK